MITVTCPQSIPQIYHPAANTFDSYDHCIPERKKTALGSSDGFIRPEANLSASSWVGLWVDNTSSPESASMTTISKTLPLLRTFAVSPKLSLLKVANREPLTWLLTSANWGYILSCLLKRLIK